ncbi:MAG TPA: 23S rRNA pseudouridine(2604) synthase RluF [Pedobacter sp.]|uniref:23S rRNA pseudouridine(2604) synthase RluF n=1 Tax=Pedobacter sp. TaxID=1411316 RepID=UPI002C53EBD5|nr:23S rRNA pseudouridine(2604) synthase RluF [Pedobacter sp.]HMI01581.1 23S rRNA pseudouridine(2604) synthase RluF [Pedobacter sp.]
MSDSTTRLNKYISESGLCSRRAADRYIEQGNVIINGKKAKVGDKVFFGDIVTVNGQTIEPKEVENTVLIAYNKPVGITSTTEAGVKSNIVDHVNHSERVFPIGRLDKDSQGLIFLTNNGDLVNKILRAGNNHEKEYLVTVSKPVTDTFLAGMAKGVPVLGVMTKKCKVSKEGNNVFKITLIQGLNRQIRRMCEHFGFEVTKLERVRIMNVSVKGIPLGEWRELTPEEQTEIYNMVAKSSSLEDASKPKKNKGELEDQGKGPAAGKTAPAKIGVAKKAAPARKPNAKFMSMKEEDLMENITPGRAFAKGRSAATKGGASPYGSSGPRKSTGKSPASTSRADRPAGGKGKAVGKTPGKVKGTAASQGDWNRTGGPDRKAKAKNKRH